MAGSAAARFSDDWLALREPVDHRSRALGLIGSLNGFLLGRPAPASVIDLGAGSGANLRYLQPRLAVGARWRLLDHDAALLERARTGWPHGTVTAEVCDLADATLSARLAGADLITASALLDLASAEWIARLCTACAATGAALLAALTIDGRNVFDPPDALDGRVLAALARDERRDKGLGLALGPDAAAALARDLGVLGYRVLQARSDWLLDGVDAALAHELLRGWAQAAARQCPDDAPAFGAWAERRAADVRSGRMRLRVGHLDVLALPP